MTDKNSLFFWATNTQASNETSTLTWEDMQEVQVDLNKHKEKQSETFQQIFKELFGGDYKRGDVAVFTEKQKAIYDMFCRELPSQILKQIRIDRSGMLEKSVVLRGGLL